MSQLQAPKNVTLPPLPIVFNACEKAGIRFFEIKKLSDDTPDPDPQTVAELGPWYNGPGWYFINTRTESIPMGGFAKEADCAYLAYLILFVGGPTK